MLPEFRLSEHPVASQGLFGSLEFGIWILPFDLAQGGELVEPFDICYLMLGICYIQKLNFYLVIPFNFIVNLWNASLGLASLDG